MSYNAGQRKDVQAAKKAGRVAEAQRAEFVRLMMSTINGRAYASDMLGRCHIFATSYRSSPLDMAFAEGERNAGLQLLNDIMTYCPEQYVQMQRESNERHLTAERRTAGDDDSGPTEHSGVEDVGRDVEGRDYDLFGDHNPAPFNN